MCSGWSLRTGPTLSSGQLPVRVGQAVQGSGRGSDGRGHLLPQQTCAHVHTGHISQDTGTESVPGGGEESEAIRLLQGCAPNQCRRNLWKASLFHLTVAPSFDPDWKYSHTTLLRVSSARASKSAKHSI